MLNREPVLRYLILEKMPFDVQVPGPLQMLLVICHMHHCHAVRVGAHEAPHTQQLPKHAAHPLGLADRQDQGHKLSLGSTESGDMLELGLVDDERPPNKHTQTRGRPPSVGAIAMITITDKP